MKIARFFAYVFAAIGLVLLAGSMGFFLLNRNAPVRVLELPQGAVSCSDAFAQALNGGDLEGASQLIYGQPDLGVGRTLDTAESALLWDGFVNSIEFAYTGDCYAQQKGLFREASVTAMDLSAVLGKLPERTQALLDQKIASAESLADIYDENNQFRAELVTQILQEALQQGLAREAETVTREVTVQLIHREGSWWVVPDQNLLQILTGLA